MRIISLFSFLFITFSLQAQDNMGKCQEMHYVQGEYYIIQSQVRLATHLILPSNLAVKPVIANDLWTVQGVPNTPHVWITPNSETELGKVATFSIITVDKKSYDFQLIQSENHSVCVIIKDKGGDFVENENHLSTLFVKSKKPGNSQKIDNTAVVGEALRRYQSTLHGGYYFKKGIISSVVDDGRFTYFKLKANNQGLPSITGIVNKRETVLQSDFNKTTLTYRVAGIFDKFIVRFDKKKIRIIRH